MTSKLKIWIIVIFIILAIGAGVYFLIKQNNQPGRLDDFAKCIKDKGAKFYGAFWCSHCQNQKSLFGKSEKYLPYIECSTPDSRGQLEVCKQANIQGYPTWEFPDGSRQEGEISLKELSDKLGCPLQ
ncbi:MAG: hypothetical protein A3C58_00465 [Candidatus Staskawiczbacteria bacterium RIFCSPHIGHO2_02_FULL_34_10]|uniref:Thioredoxin domain-containing protein n=2 Tax=Candidatus Staskawicziibacteriota TaxID=1817916 RepID=A0A1G2HK64_9BACT|nr:MAG: hypothetical protein A2639_00060 [Candidatus Staskawiczbacteria bacterium RIFCSPHIGHO2_01_FULL_34_27]OGZ66914.1 MAG: hypothetical protein A3C58_00465 [Candidatus Staskawiczbacteria bacterium RIFCSPHIGHO2_02_FULL_34_10]